MAHIHSQKYSAAFFLFLSGVVFLLGCGDKVGEEDAFTADFSFEFINENNVRFVNKAEGIFHISNWDFGNGQTETSTSKTQQYEVYYPEAGKYTVTLTVIGTDGTRKPVTKTVTITKTDFQLSFTAEYNSSNQNNIILVNTTQGNYDSFKWIYRNREIANETNTIAYFPFAGTYSIELQVLKNGETYSVSKTVNITGDDPNYNSNFILVWSDEFDGNSVNTANWAFETGAGGWGNNELQNYTNGENAEVKDGKLILTAKKVNNNTSAGSFTSSRLISKGKQEFTYGRMEIRAKLPSGKGIWPAIWMLGANISSVNWPACGEIDIMEYVGYQPNTIHATVHTSAGSGSAGSGSSKSLETAEEEFHIYGLLWTEKELVFYTDSPENVTHKYAPVSKTDNNWPFNKPQFFILNVAVGGNWGGAQGIDNSIFPQSMEIDYVRVFQSKN